MIKYSKDHEWIKIVEDDIALVGITDFAQSELGEIVYVEVESVGETICQDDVFGTIEAVKTTSDLFMPVDADVIAFNPELDESEGDNPALVNEDAEGEAWIVKVRVHDKNQLEGLLDIDAYNELIS